MATDSNTIRPRKRQRGEDDTEGGLHQTPAKARKGISFQTGESVREQARPRRIAVARMCIKDLTPKWTLGQNRPIDKGQVQKLLNIFKRGGVNRTAKEHYLQLLCSSSEVTRMKAHLGLEERTMETPTEGILCFNDWHTVNQTQVEIMAGQHRVEALKAYMLETKSEAKEGWWICEIYDQVELNLALRVNRQDTVKTDSHGQIWSQVAAISSKNPDLFQGNCAAIEKQMIQALQLSGDIKFPSRRLATVWRNERWRDVTNRWCNTSIGKATFQITTWDRMISYRIDDFWFGAIRNVLRTLSELPGEAAEDVSLSDWGELSNWLSVRRTEGRVRDLFYPDTTAETVDSTSSRRPKLLSGLGDRGYWEVYERILKTPQLQFVDAHRLFHLAREDERILSLMMCHIVAWFPSKPNHAARLTRRDNNKPPLRRDILPALQSCSDQFIRVTEKRLGLSLWDAGPLPAPEAASILLQQEALDFVRARFDAFKNPSAKEYIEQLPEKVSPEQYADRFQDEVWAGVLRIVRQYVGNDFQSGWTTDKRGPVQPPSYRTAPPKTATDSADALSEAQTDRGGRVIRVSGQGHKPDRIDHSGTRTRTPPPPPPQDRNTAGRYVGNEAEDARCPQRASRRRLLPSSATEGRDSSEDRLASRKTPQSTPTPTSTEARALQQTPSTNTKPRSSWRAGYRAA
ncbi:hypothetical protein AUP68_10853 [Ilyonectria robusta]